MKLKIYQVDAFTSKVFHGNPAAVCPLEEWIPENLLQQIAMENNLSETAFFVKNNNHYEIRWFTPKTEVDLCGHATLASAYVLFNLENYQGNSIHFYSTRSGELIVTRNEKMITLNFPVDIPERIDMPKFVNDIFNIKPSKAFKGKTDYLFIYKSENDIKKLVPAFHKMADIPVRGIMVSARGDEVDFVSRFFAPQSGIPEDPVTGSAHTTLTPYWSKALNKQELSAIQLSDRKGFLQCKYLDTRVEISGEAQLYLTGKIQLGH